MKKRHLEIKAKGKPDHTTLFDHLTHVLHATEKLAEYGGIEIEIARMGAILHDIGKVHPVFQERLDGGKSSQSFRHEITSLFFLPLIPKSQWKPMIEMIIAHHKSIKHDMREKGILDLVNNENETLSYHLGDWEEWSPIALEILESFGLETRSISRAEAIAVFWEVVDFCKNAYRQNGYSEWRGLLMGADHFASAMIHKTDEKLVNLFQRPKLNFFNRTSPDYPLSLYHAESPKSHTLVVAPTGAGKTDFLFRRCRGRVFYTLPFQASINAMFSRLKKDLKENNPDLNIKILHAASTLLRSEEEDREDTILQRHMGASIKVLTPYQMVGIIFASKGYEAMILDMKGCDVILDEVHTYSGVSQALVLRIVSVLKSIGCRLHIGTATMPSLLYDRIRSTLGADHVLEVKMKEEELTKYDRHTITKLESWEETPKIYLDAIHRGEKLLIVCNTIQKAQEIYLGIKLLLHEKELEVDTLLLHSKYKRKDRREKEVQLLGLDEAGDSVGKFNTSQSVCIVISTQVVEVSLDISFDAMVTECAPLDAMIQRFGRINRKRTPETIGTLKPIYVIKPFGTEKEVRPYNLETILKSFEVLPDRGPLHEVELQGKIDQVFDELAIIPIEEHAQFDEKGEWNIPLLCNGDAWLVKLLEIDSVSCITESDVHTYLNSSYPVRMGLEIPARFHQVKHLGQLDVGSSPYIIPDDCYDPDIGLSQESLKSSRINPKPEIH